MNIEQLTSDKLRVMLSLDDLRKYNLDYMSISSESAATKLLVTDILIDAKNMAGFTTKSSGLLIEVLPGKNKGCILLLTKIPLSMQIKRKTKTSEDSLSLSSLLKEQNNYILSCNCLDDTIDAINCFASYPDIPLSKSALYDLDGKYHLIFSPIYFGTDKKRLFSLLSLLSEYGKTNKTDPIREAVLIEHGNPISCNRAVENMLRFFN
jgi:adapter protein MecA 1/2